MAKLPVSVCMISGAEAGRIGRALQSVADRAGELIVVLNEEVRDGTDALCEAQGAKVYREPWRGFVAQKNSAADKASCPWILSLDADEEVPPGLWAEIAAVLDDPGRNRPYAAFDFPRCSFYCGRWIRHGDWYPDRVVRLWRRGSGVWRGIEIHERLEVKGTVGHLRSDLRHYSNPSINWQLQKISRYADPFVRHCLETGRQVGWLDLTVRPAWKFLRAYFLRQGFLDGWPGFYIAALNSFSTLTRYALVREAAERKQPEQ
jgi:glycosyltransferase involved in cell wall biosynthesis